MFTLPTVSGKLLMSHENDETLSLELSSLLLFSFFFACAYAKHPPMDVKNTVAMDVPWAECCDIAKSRFDVNMGNATNEPPMPTNEPIVPATDPMAKAVMEGEFIFL